MILDRVRMVAAYLLGRPRWKIFPQEIVIELTNHCNLACVMCPQKDMTRNKGFMEESLFRSIVDQAAGRAELVYLYGTGESLLHKKLPEYIAYARSKGLTTVLSTNIIPLTEQSANAVLNSGLDYLIIAMDGASKETYESIRVGAKFEKLIANVKMVLAIRGRLKTAPRIQMQMIISERTAHEVSAFKMLFTPDELRQIDLFRLKPLFDTYARPGNAVRHTRPCYWLWNMAAIAWDGRMQLCCMDFDAVAMEGNVRDTSIDDLWNSSRFNEIRARVRKVDYSDISLCRGCDIPEQGYFSFLTILASTFISAYGVRRLMPLFERLVILRNRLAARRT